jgi:hypothetical protein
MPNREGIDGRILDLSVAISIILIVYQMTCYDGTFDNVLANMRGAGEPVLKQISGGTDMMATLRAEPYGKERFEMELETRLRLAGQGGVRS